MAEGYMTSGIDKQKLYGIIIYTVVTSFISAAGLIFLLVEIPESGQGSPDVLKQVFWMLHPSFLKMRARRLH